MALVTPPLNPGLVVLPDQHADPALRVSGRLRDELRGPTRGKQLDDLKMRPLNRVLFSPISLIQPFGICVWTR